MVHRVASDPVRRFWSKVQVRPNFGCWLWLGCKDRKGYGRFWYGEKRRSAGAHSVAYEMMLGEPAPKAPLSIDHLCRNRACVNPFHFDVCSRGKNAARSPSAPYNLKRAWTHCKRGHIFDVKNTAYNSSGRRSCRTCSRNYYYSKRRGARLGKREGA